ncbi:hypothetical protein GS580_27720 [Rhodococcus hoagii]|nr:hypothetical protein [Prescottella equi]
MDDRPREEGGYTSNKKYDTDPQAMLYAKAATEVARKIAPDVLLGIAHSREELELDAPVLATSERVKPKARGVAALEAALTPAAETEPALDADSLLAAVEQAPDIESLREMWKQAAALTDDDCTTVRAVIDGRLADLKEPQ